MHTSILRNFFRLSIGFFSRFDISSIFSFIPDFPISFSDFRFFCVSLILSVDSILRCFDFQILYFSTASLHKYFFDFFFNFSSSWFIFYFSIHPIFLKIFRYFTISPFLSFSIYPIFLKFLRHFTFLGIFDFFPDFFISRFFLFLVSKLSDFFFDF